MGGAVTSRSQRGIDPPKIDGQLSVSSLFFGDRYRPQSEEPPTRTKGVGTRGRMKQKNTKIPHGDGSLLFIIFIHHLKYNAPWFSHLADRLQPLWVLD